MLLVLPFYSGDKSLAVNLANWIAQLGGAQNHNCLLIVDKSTTSAGVIEPLRKAFKSVTETSSEPAGEQASWGNGTTDATAPNEMFLTASAYIYHKQLGRWFWAETDIVPTRPTWLDEIEAEDKRGKKPFTGAYVDIPPHEPHMSGIAVYPSNVPDHSLKMATPGQIAWDYAGRSDTVGKGKAHFTTLIQHEYRIDGVSPTFPTQKSLSVIKPGTAVFHRCKDFSLIDRLRENLQLDGAIKRITSHIPTPGEPSASEKRLSIKNKLLLERVEELEEKLNLDIKIAPEVTSFSILDENVRLMDENAALKAQVAELTAKLNCQERLAPALAAATPKKKYVMTPEHKAKLAQSRQKRKTGIL